jgi:hypothetical protein
MKRLTLHCLASSLHNNRAKLSNTDVKAMTAMFFSFATEIMGKMIFFGNCQ